MPSTHHQTDSSTLSLIASASTSLTLLSLRSPMIFFSCQIDHLEDIFHFLRSLASLKQEAQLIKHCLLFYANEGSQTLSASLAAPSQSPSLLLPCCLKSWFSKDLPSSPFSLYFASPWVILHTSMVMKHSFCPSLGFHHFFAGLTSPNQYLCPSSLISAIDFSVRVISQKQNIITICSSSLQNPLLAPKCLRNIIQTYFNCIMDSTIWPQSTSWVLSLFPPWTVSCGRTGIFEVV